MTVLSPAKNLIQSLSPLTMYGRITGCTPYKLQITNNNNVIATTDKVLIIIRILVNTAFEYFYEEQPKNIEDMDGHGPILTFLRYTVGYVNIAVCNLYVLLGFLQRHKIEYIVKELLHIDQQLQYQGIKVNQFNDQLAAISIICLYVIKTSVIFLWVAMSQQDRQYYLIKYAIFIIPSSSMHLHFVTILFIIQRRYTLLKQHIKFSEKSEHQNNTEWFPILEKLKHIQRTLLCITRMLLKAFEIQVLIRLANIYLLANYSLFFLFKSLRLENGTNYVWLRIYYFIYDISELILLVFVCRLTTDQVK